ncbi:MAG TPA: PaaI family thioesterase [Candidatus Cybelea sp.]|nr:PaaI family thioesterase [Candidatus Cybelea sp.]
MSGVDPKLIGKAMLEHVPHIRELGLELTDAGNGRGTMRLAYQERLVGDPETGVLNGGVITTVIDSVCGVAVQTALRKPITIATLDLRIDYLRPSTPGKVLIAEAECYKVTRHVAFVRARAWNDDPQHPVAHCVGTFMLGSPSVRRPRPKPETAA